MIKLKTCTNSISPLLLMLCSSLAVASSDIEVTGDQDNRTYSPYAGKNYPQQVFWGDTHIHTKMSADAYNLDTRLSPEDALRFARGETVVSTTGKSIRLSRPLDFAVVSDHAAFLGVMNLLGENDPQFLAPNVCAFWHTPSLTVRHQSPYPKTSGHYLNCHCGV